MLYFILHNLLPVIQRRKRITTGGKIVEQVIKITALTPFTPLTGFKIDVGWATLF